MALKSLKVAFLTEDDNELVIVNPSNQDWLDAEGEELSAAALPKIEAMGLRFVKERIGYSGKVKVRVLA